MKTPLTILLLLLPVLLRAQSDEFDHMMEKYENRHGIITFSMSGKMYGKNSAMRNINMFKTIITEDSTKTTTALKTLISDLQKEVRLLEKSYPQSSDTVVKQLSLLKDTQARLSLIENEMKRDFNALNADFDRLISGTEYEPVSSFAANGKTVRLFMKATNKTNKYLCSITKSGIVQCLIYMDANQDIGITEIRSMTSKMASN